MTQFLIMMQARNCHYHRISHCLIVHNRNIVLELWLQLPSMIFTLNLDIDILTLLVQLPSGEFTDEWLKQLLNNPGEGIPVQDEVW